MDAIVGTGGHCKGTFKAVREHSGDGGLIRLTGASGCSSPLAMTVKACKLVRAPWAWVLQV